MQRFAINLADALTFRQRFPLVFDALLAPVLSRELRTMSSARWDSEAALLKPDILCDQWQAIIEVLKLGQERHKIHVLRLYETDERGKRWRKLARRKLANGG